MPYDLEQLEIVRAKLTAMPEVQRRRVITSKQDAIGVLAPGITAMQKRGYTLEEIAAALTSEGIEIKTATLKNYLTRIKRTKPRRRASEQPASTPESPTASTPAATGGGEGGAVAGAGGGAAAGDQVSSVVAGATTAEQPARVPVMAPAGAPTAAPAGTASGTAESEAGGKATFTVRPDSRDI